MEPIRVLPAREQVAAILRKAILAGEYQSGEFLTLDRVAELAGVSRTPVREAFQILAMEGLIALRPNRGAQVRELTAESIQDHFSLRALLEEEAARRAALAAPAKGCPGLDQAFRREALACQLMDLELFKESNEAFHLAVWELAGSERLQMLLGQLWNGTALDAERMRGEYMERAHKEHAEIYQAIQAGEASRAQEAMRSHLRQSAEAALARFCELQQSSRTEGERA